MYLGSAIKCYYHTDASIYTTASQTQDCPAEIDMCQAVYESSKNIWIKTNSMIYLFNQPLIFQQLKKWF